MLHVNPCHATVLLSASNKTHVTLLLLWLLWLLGAVTCKWTSQQLALLVREYSAKQGQVNPGSQGCQHYDQGIL